MITGRTIPPVSAIADVLALWGRDGWLTPPLAPVVAAPEPTIGRVQTVSVTVGPAGPGLSPIYDVLSADLTDRFLVVAGVSTLPGAMFGEILALAACRRGALGALVHGNVRDRPEMAEVGLPVYAAGQCVVGPNGFAHIVEVGGPVQIQGTAIDPEDLVVVDANGCVRVPALDADAVLDAAARYASAEELVVATMGSGRTLAEAYHHKKSIVDELRR
jgi:4-hydroxy-4-methyl-2-oxoglutarate aldolase